MQSSGAEELLASWSSSTGATVVLVLGLATLILLVLLMKVVMPRRNFVRKLEDMPGPKTLPIIGNCLLLLGASDDFFRLLTQCAKNYGDRFVLWVGLRPFVFLQSAETIKPVLNSTLHIDKSFEYSFLSPWVGSGLLISSGELWHSRRKLLTPAFHSRVLADFLEPAHNRAHVFVRRLLRAANPEQSFNVIPLAKRCFIDLICETAMGCHTNCLEDDDSSYAHAIEEICSILQRRFIKPWLKPNFFFNVSSYGRHQKSCLETIHGFTNKVIKERQEELQNHMKFNGNLIDKENSGQFVGQGVCANGGKLRLALLDLLLEQQSQCGKQVLSDDDIRDEVNTFMFAGHDTLANTLSWCMYTLGRHPEIQNQVADEARTALVDYTAGEITLQEVLQRLPLLEACLKETLRLYPSAPLIARDIKTPIDIGSHTLPPGVTVLMNLYLVHRDPQYFHHPESFLPERFLTSSGEQPHSLNPFAYVPFSAGSRNCIGQRYAMMQAKMVLAIVLSELEIRSHTAPEDLNLMGEVVLVNKEGVLVSVAPRS